jgi:amino acid permease
MMIQENEKQWLTGDEMDDSISLYGSGSSEDDGNGDGDGLPGIDRVGAHKKATLAGSVANAICSSVGAGIISLPSACQAAGWIAVPLLAVTGCFAGFTANLLGKSLSKLVTTGRVHGARSYSSLGGEAVATRWPERRRWGVALVSVVQMAALLGVCTSFLILAGSNLAMLTGVLTVHDWVLLCGVAMILPSWLKTMRELAFVSIFGVASSFFVAGVIVVLGVMRGSTDANVRYDIVNAAGLPVAFNVVVFSYGGHSILPTIYRSMGRAPANWRAFCVLTYSIITAVYIEVAMCGYAGYGVDTAGNILENIGGGVVGKIAAALITAHVLLAYPLPLNPVSLYIEDHLGIDKLPPRRELVTRIATRTLTVAATAIVAAVVPYFAQMVGIVSAFTIIALVFVFPIVIFYLVVPEQCQNIYFRAFLLFLLCFAIFTLVVGMYFAVVALVDVIHDSSTGPFQHFFSN